MRMITAIVVLAMLYAIAPTDVEAHRRHGRHIRGHRAHFGGLHVGPCTSGEFDADGDGKLNDEEIAAARDARKAEILAEYDANGDGTLGDAERIAAHEAKQAEREARRAERIAEHDTDGDGELSEDERDAARAARQAEILAEFDTDGDGELNGEEAEAARAAHCAAKSLDEDEDDGEETVLALALSLDFVRGDANDDGAFDIGDPISVLNFLFLGGESMTCADAADANDDGELDVADPTAALASLFLGNGPLPAPVDVPSFDPTIDDLTCDGIVLSGL